MATGPSGRVLPPDTAVLRHYVVAQDHLQYTNLADGMIQLNVTHSNLARHIQEIRLDLHTTIAGVKEKLRTHVGTGVGDMVLQLKSEGTVMAVMDDDSKMLGYYSPTNGMTIHIVDTNKHSLSAGGAFDDTSLVKKFELTDDQYDKLDYTVRAYRKKKLAEDPSFKFHPKAGPKVDYESKECVDGINVGDRCEVSPGARRGEVMYVGKVKGLPAGFWVGVRFDEPVGKGDGSVKGKRYYECSPKYGAFARPTNVKCGDYPPIDDFGSDFDDSDEEEGAAAAASEVTSEPVADSTACACSAAGGCAPAATQSAAPAAAAAESAPAAEEEDDDDDEL